MKKDKVTTPHKMGKDDLMKVDKEAEDDLMRSKEVEYNLMRSEEIRGDLIRSDMGDNLMKSKEEEENEEEVEDVMSRLFDWDFDQLIRQVENITGIMKQSTTLVTKSLWGSPLSRPQLSLKVF